MSKTPAWYMIVCKFKVDKDKDTGAETWKLPKQANLCNEMLHELGSRAKGDYHRIRHVFYFKSLDDALMFKLSYYDAIKYVAFLDSEKNLIK